MIKKLVVLVSFSSAISLADAQALGSHQYCDQLADIGSNAYEVKKAGYPMSHVISRINPLLAHDRQKQTAAQGVIIAIYGDSSIRSARQAYKTTYSACRQ